MKLMRKTALAVLPLALTAATIVRAESGDAGGDWEQRRVERLQSKLNLSEEQTQTIQSTYAADQDARRRLQSQLRQAVTNLRRAALNGDDAATLQSKRAAAQQAFGELLDLRVKELGKIGAVLSPDQRQGFAEMKVGDRHGHRGKHRMHTDSAPSDD